MFLTAKQRENLGIVDDDEGFEKAVLANGVCNGKSKRISSLRTKNLPPQYKTNSAKENVCLKHVEQFCIQFEAEHPNRMKKMKKLFICPLNECGIPKFVCCTVRPSRAPYETLYYAKSIAHFFAGFLEFEPLGEFA